jgi:competence ComEA-like helix-hairpin-helix protein
MTQKTDNQSAPTNTTGYLIILAIIAAVVIYRLSTTAPINAPHPSIAPADIDRRLNPNTANWGQLAALPGIGETRAKAIIEYRENNNTNAPAFQSPEDLTQVHGLGPKTVENIRESLRFKDDATVNGKW